MFGTRSLRSELRTCVEAMQNIDKMQRREALFSFSQTLIVASADLPKVFP